MKKVYKDIFFLLTNSFMITAVSLLLAWLGGDSSFFESLFGTVGFYGAIVTIYLFLGHLIFVILAVIFKKNDSGI